MSRKMLINAIHPEESRIAIVEDGTLVDLEIESSGQQQLKGNIYKAKITRIEPSLQAAFLDIGSNRNGFLQINDINQAYFKTWPPEDANGRLPRPSIQDVLEADQDLIVQVVKDEREAKGATLTTNLSIPGRYLVLMVGNQRGGVSRKIVDAGQRSRLKEAVSKLRVPPGMSVIVRTAGINKSSTELQGDLDNLLKTWSEVIEKSIDQTNTPIPLFEESSLIIRTLRDFVTSSFDEILIDDKAVYENSIQFIESALPGFSERVKHYDEPLPIFSKYLLDAQIETIDKPEVTLPSGGSIVIDTTEAVVCIDVNSGRATSQADVEETAFATNKEAAEMIARQLRLRDLGGLVVIDFIDMSDRKHRQAVEKTLKDAVKVDKAKVELSRISKFGLLEMSRQRLKTSLSSQRYAACPYCAGRGRVKTTESAALEALRKIESSVYAGGLEQVKIRLNPTAALFLLNEKRRSLSKLEDETNVEIKVVADGRLRQHEYELELVTTKKESIVSSSSTTPARSEGREKQSRGDSRNRSGRGGRSSRKRQGKNSNQRRGRRNRSGGKRRNDQNDQSEEKKDSGKSDSSGSSVEAPAQ